MNILANDYNYKKSEGPNTTSNSNAIDMTKKEIRIFEKETRKQKRACKKEEKLLNKEPERYSTRKKYFEEAMTIELMTISKMEEYDLNQDCEITKDEVPEEMEAIFDKLDKAYGEEYNDGKLAFEELNLYHQFVDANGDGKLEDYELQYADKKIKYSNNPFKTLAKYGHKEMSTKKIDEYLKKIGKFTTILFNFKKSATNVSGGINAIKDTIESTNSLVNN